MNLIDSSAWLAFFADTKNAEEFVPPLKDKDRLLVPTIVMYEVFKVLLREKAKMRPSGRRRTCSKGQHQN